MRSMSILAVLLSIIFHYQSFAQNINTPENFPDPQFRRAVEELMGAEPGGAFSQNDCAAKTGQFDCSDREIASMEGIENFTGITELNCRNITGQTPIFSIVIPKQSSLQKIDCSGNARLSRLDIGNPTIVRSLNISDTNIDPKNYDLSQFVLLNYFNCASTPLSRNSLDFSNNIQLKTLICNHTSLRTLNITGNRFLTYLDCSYTILDELNVSNNINLEHIDCSHIWNYPYHSNPQNFISLDLFNNRKLKHVDIAYTNIRSFDTSHLPNLMHLNITGTYILEFDTSNNPELAILLCSLLGEATGSNTDIQIKNNPKLETLHCYSSRIQELDISQYKNLKSVVCYRNQIINNSSKVSFAVKPV